MPLHRKRIAREAARRTRTPLDAAQLGHKVGRVIARHKPAPESHRGMAKHFRWAVHDGRLVYERDYARIDAEARLDGIYVLAVSPPRGSPHKTRCAPTRDWPTSNAGSAPSKGSTSGCAPIRHREQRRVRAHLFLCLLAGYLEWHLRRAWAPLLFHDETLADARRTRDPVAPPSLLLAPGAKRHPGVATTDGPFTASIPCSANSRPAAATPVGSPPTPRPRPCLCSPSRHRFSVAPHTSSKRSQYRELPKTEMLMPINQLNFVTPRELRVNVSIRIHPIPFFLECTGGGYGRADARKYLISRGFVNAYRERGRLARIGLAPWHGRAGGLAVEGRHARGERLTEGTFSGRTAGAFRPGGDAPVWGLARSCLGSRAAVDVDDEVARRVHYCAIVGEDRGGGIELLDDRRPSRMCPARSDRRS